MDSYVLVEQILYELKPYLDKTSYRAVERIVTSKLKDYKLERIEETYDLSTDVDYSYHNYQIFELYKQELRLCDLAKTSQKQYIRVVENLVRMYPSKPFEMFTYYDIIQYLSDMDERDVKNTTYNNEIRYLNSFFKYLTDNLGVIKQNPMKKIRSRKETKQLKKALTSSEVEKILSCATNQRDRAMFMFFISTGMRINEVVNCRVSDVNLTDRTVFVRKAKGNKQREVYLSSRALFELEQYLTTRDSKSDMLFDALRKTDKVGLSSGGIACAFSKMSELSGVPFHPHKLRRTFATNMYLKDVPINEIQRLMGHEEVQTTLIYIDMVNDKTKSIALTVLG